MKNDCITLTFFAAGDGESANSISPDVSQNAENENRSITDISTDSADKDADFEQLIRGEYRSAFAKRTQAIIDKRFSRAKESEKTAMAVKPLLETLRQLYPNKTDENDLVETAVTVLSAAAKSGKPLAFGTDTDAGTVPEESKVAVKASNVFEKEASAGTHGENTAEPPESNESRKHNLMTNIIENAREAYARRIIDDWRSQALSLKTVYPSFDLEKEIKAGGEFTSLLRAGVSVRRAFEASNIENILGSAMRYAAGEASKKTAAAMRQAPSRVQENSVLGRAASVQRTDVNSLTEKEIMKILTLVGKGAKISF